MPARALLVLLVMLNLGVATWWALRPGPDQTPRWTPPPDIPRLQLLAERGPAPAQAPVRQDAGTPAAGAAAGSGGAERQASDASGAGEETGGLSPEAAAALRCLAFGPFDDAAGVAAARAALRPLGAVRMRVRDVVDAPRGWRVMLPAQPDRATADALAGRIRDAGFSDLLVVPSGADTNAIALGLYGSEPAARRRESALRAAGFPVQALPVGDAVTRHWLDVAVGAGFDADAARAATSAPRMQDIACAGDIEAGGSR